mmetsp:Transcript_56/g.160  ORF Transcript_56/g.160 Transcript_56/m.160 type:complete len:238 (-) Transcript_56:240-953(-)
MCSTPPVCACSTRRSCSPPARQPRRPPARYVYSTREYSRDKLLTITFAAARRPACPGRPRALGRRRTPSPVRRARCARSARRRGGRRRSGPGLQSPRTRRVSRRGGSAGRARAAARPPAVSRTRPPRARGRSARRNCRPRRGRACRPRLIRPGAPTPRASPGPRVSAVRPSARRRRVRRPSTCAVPNGPDYSGTRPLHTLRAQCMVWFPRGRVDIQRFAETVTSEQHSMWCHQWCGR